MECAWTVATDADRLYKRYILDHDFMHILKFFDEWVIDTTKMYGLPLSRLLEKNLNFITTLISIDWVA